MYMHVLYIPANILHPHLCFWRHFFRFTLQIKRNVLTTSAYLLFMDCITMTLLFACPLTSSSSLKTDASPAFFGGSDGTGSLGF